MAVLIFREVLPDEHVKPPSMVVDDPLVPIFMAGLIVLVFVPVHIFTEVDPPTLALSTLPIYIIELLPIVELGNPVTYYKHPYYKHPKLTILFPDPIP